MLQSVHSYNCQDVLRTGRPLRLLESYVGLKASMNCVMKRKGHTALKPGLTYGHDFMKRRDRVRRLVGPSPTCARHPPPTCRCRLRTPAHAPMLRSAFSLPPTCARHPSDMAGTHPSRLAPATRSSNARSARAHGQTHGPRADARPTGGNPPRAGTSDGTRPPGHQARHLRPPRRRHVARWPGANPLRRRFERPGGRPG
jgi:hypothetical protein